ncbi:MAG: DNA-binding protein [Oscillospiraceae bacterium]
MDNYISVAEASKEWGLSARRVYTLCAEGRIPGATRFVRVWAIPRDSKKPDDARIKSGKYIGYSEKYHKKDVKQK